MQPVLARVLLSAVIVIAASPARAQDPSATERARLHFDLATQAFDTGNYELATTEFQRAHELTGHPDLLFNIYSSAERAGHLEVAVDALARFLAEGSMDDTQRATLEQRLLRLRERMAARARAQQTPRSDAAPEPAPDGVHPAGIGVLIGAGVLGAGFAVLAVLSELEDTKLAQGCGATRSCTDGDVATLSALNLAADVTWITAAAAAAVGVVLLLALPPDPAGRENVALAPWMTREAAGLVATGRF